MSLVSEFQDVSCYELLTARETTERLFVIYRTNRWIEQTKRDTRVYCAVASISIGNDNGHFGITASVNAYNFIIPRFIFISRNNGSLQKFGSGGHVVRLRYSGRGQWRANGTPVSRKFFKLQSFNRQNVRCSKSTTNRDWNVERQVSKLRKIEISSVFQLRAISLLRETYTVNRCEEKRVKLRCWKCLVTTERTMFEPRLMNNFLLVTMCTTCPENLALTFRGIFVRNVDFEPVLLIVSPRVPRA